MDNLAAWLIDCWVFASAYTLWGYVYMHEEFDMHRDIDIITIHLQQLSYDIYIAENDSLHFF